MSRSYIASQQRRLTENRQTDRPNVFIASNISRTKQAD